MGIFGFRFVILKIVALHNYLKKLRHVMPIFILTVVGSVLVLSLIRYIFFIQLSVFVVKKEFWEFWIPIIFPLIPVMLWMRPRFRVLNFNDKFHGQGFFIGLSWLILFCVLLNSQAYLSNETGSLEKVLNVAKINNRKTNKINFYEIERFLIDTASSGTFVRSNVSGKHGSRLNYTISYVAPVVSDSSALNKDIPKYWFGLKFKKQISNKITGSEKEALYQTFYKKTMEKISYYDFKNIGCIKKLSQSNERDSFLDAVEASTGIYSEDYVILQSIYGSYENRGRESLRLTLFFFGGGSLLMALLLIWPKFREQRSKRKV